MAKGVRSERFRVFGWVVAGMVVVDAIGSAETDANDKPLQDVMLIRASIIEQDSSRERLLNDLEIK